MTDFAASNSADVAIAITPSDSTLMPETRGVYVGVGGDVVALMKGAAGTYAAVTFKNVPSGAVLPIRCTRINSTNTTASSLVALY